jgi:hypothetical protein
MTKHKHGIACYARNASGPLAYTPCREDGLDRHLTNLNEADFKAGTGLRGLTLVCTLVEGQDEED